MRYLYWALMLIILLGVVIRLYALDSIPPGLDNDEGIYAYNGCRYLAQGTFRMFVDYGLKWETPIGYLFAVATRAFGARVLVIRYLSALASILLLPLLYLLGKCLWNPRAGTLAAAFAGVSFLLVFYGRLGWCASHVLLLECAALYGLLRFIDDGRYRWLMLCAGISFLGLATYATFRAMAAYLLLASCILGRGSCGRLRAALGSVAVPVTGYLLAVRVTEGSLKPVVERGMHNVTLPRFSAVQNYLHTLGLPFQKPPAEFRLISKRFFGDAVHALLHDTFARPECAILSGVLVCCTGVALILAVRKAREGAWRDPLILTVAWVAVYFAIVGYVGPSYTRMLGILPPMLLISGCVADKALACCSARSTRWGMVLGAAIAAVAALCLCETFGRLLELGPSNSRARFTFNWNPVQMIANAKARGGAEDRVKVFSAWGREAVQYLTVDIPFHETFTDYAVAHCAAPPSEGRARRLYILQESKEADALVRHVETNYKGVRATQFRIDETGARYVELLIPPGQADEAPRQAGAATSGPTRILSLLEGGEGSAPGEYKEPRGIAVDAEGNVFVADFRNYRIQKFGPDGLFAAAWGEKGRGPGQLSDPCDVKADAKGRVYVADTFNHRIQSFGPDGTFVAEYKGGLFAPRGIAVDRKGRVWVADTGNGAVKLFTAVGEPPRLIGDRGKGDGEFDAPVGIAVDRKGKVYVADAGNRRVQVFDSEGRYLTQFAVDGWKGGVFNEPYLDIDARGGLYLTDPPGHRVLRYSVDGKPLGVWKPIQGDEPFLKFPMGIAVQNKGDAVYVVDCRHHRIRRCSKRDFR